jgi:group I intron endonuclease
MSKSGIYKITNIQNNKMYIGSSVNVTMRITRHKVDLKRNTHPNTHLQRTYNKNGKKVFIYEVIEYCNPDRLISLEQQYIDQLNPEYNMCKQARSVLGIKRSNKTKKKLSKALKGRKFTDEHKKKLSAAKIGTTRIFTEEHKNKISQALIGRTISNKNRLKVSARFKGKPWTKARRQAQINRKVKNEI